MTPLERLTRAAEGHGATIEDVSSGIVRAYLLWAPDWHSWVDGGEMLIKVSWWAGDDDSADRAVAEADNRMAYGTAPDPVPEPDPTPCGYCSGNGQVPGPTHNRFGYELSPRMLICEYCGGSGRCVGGEKLLPARLPPKPPASDGNPVWA